MKSLSELAAIRAGMKGKIATRIHGKDDIKVVVGMSTCGIAAGAKAVLAAFLDEAEKRQLLNVKVSQSGSIDCVNAPVVEVFVPGKEKVVYKNMTEQKAREVVESHLISGKPKAEYMFK